ncbi:MAG: cation:proton antiporter [Candidatus Diapherotrites archaeon]|nr:cation:proton antiporter [Candidatus Diapherotrites archaeon]
MALGKNRLLFDFGAVLFFSLLLGTLVEKIGLPAIVGYLISGLILGPQGLGIVHDSELISLMADLGIILLLFFTGLKMNPKKFSEAGVYALFLSPIKSGAVFLVGYFIALALGFTQLEAFVVGAALAGSSTAIISHAILEHGWSNRKEARIAMSMLILEDILSIFFIAYLLGYINVDVPVLKVFLHTFALAFILFSVGTYAIARLFRLLGHLIKEEHTPLYVLGLITLFAYGVSMLGISPVLGAFFAGLAIANTHLAPHLYEKMLGYKHFFVLFFFTALGLKYAISFSPTALALAILASLAVWVQVFVVLFVGPFYGLEPERAFRLGILMLPLGEFSLFFSAVAQEIGLPHAADMMGGMFLAIIITTAVAGFMIRNEERLEKIAVKLVPDWLKNRFDPYRIASSKLFTATSGNIPSNFRRFFVLFLVSYLFYYFTGYLFTSGIIGFNGYLLLYTVSSLVLAFSLVEVKRYVDDFLEQFFGFAKKRRPVGLSSALVGVFSLFLGLFFLAAGLSLKVVSLTLMSGALIGYGLLLIIYGVLRLTLFPDTH